MDESNDYSPVDRLAGLGSAYHGLVEAVAFDERLADVREYLIDQIAKLILSEELAQEIKNLTGRPKATASQTVNELCNDVFENPHWTCSWADNRQWLGDAIIVASQLGDTER